MALSRSTYVPSAGAHHRVGRAHRCQSCLRYSVDSLTRAHFPEQRPPAQPVIFCTDAGMTTALDRRRLLAVRVSSTTHLESTSASVATTDAGVRTGLSVDALTQALIDNLHCLQAKLPEHA